MSEEKGLTGNKLKCIAMLSMTVDHVICVLYPQYPTDWWIVMLHVLGRVAAPLFWYMIAEGYHYTHNVKKYLLRLFVFSVIGHFAYDFAFGIPFVPFKTSCFNQTSIIWPLFLGVLGLTVTDAKSLSQWKKTVLVFVLAALAFPSDWSSPALLVILSFGRNRGDFKKQMLMMLLWIAVYAAVYAIFINFLYGIIQMGVILTIPLLKQYNGKCGSAKGLKYFFYLYYPAHLVVCGIIRLMVHGNIGVMIGG
ncbi:MAG: conjugal transfer protein TraX [Treponema sp.]|nr:conjugal transfer protein TraX [Treponema sp.]